MDNWLVVLLHTHQSTLLRRAFEAAFPGRVASLHAPELGRARKRFVTKKALLDYFREQVYDPGIWDGRVLAVYGSGSYHHYTYALSKLALQRRGLRDFNWTYFHFDNHRDDWGFPEEDGYKDHLDCANFVDQLAYDHQGIPFFIGPDAYPALDSKGYTIRGTHIPIYHNFFTQKLQRSQQWRSHRTPSSQTGLELPVAADLRATPTESYLSFDLDLLGYSEMLTDFDQNEDMTLRRICQILAKIRPYKRIFSADILGLPERRRHALSCLSMIILARRIMGLGTQRLLEYHTEAKQCRGESPIKEGELIEVLKWTRC